MKKISIELWTACLLLFSIHATAQQFPTSDRWVEYVEQIAVDTGDEERAATLFSELSYLAEHPFDINLATEEQLKRLPFLSEKQIEYLVSYRTRYGEMQSIYELKNVEEMDFQTIELLLPFVRVGIVGEKAPPLTLRNAMSLGKHEVMFRYDQCLQEKEGYKTEKYIGEPFYNSLRYSYTFDDRLQAGIVAEKDAGEKIYDYYSAHALLKDIHRFKTIAIGDFKASFGQGLVLSQDFSLSRTAMVSQVERRNNGFRRHYSTNETDFLRGAATTVQVGKIDISAFYSYRKMDATVDSIYISSLKTDGLHRLPRDLDKKRAANMQTFGGNLRYAQPNLRIGLTALHYSFGDLSINPDQRPYNMFYFRGNKNTNIGVDYFWKNKLLKLFGETALSENGAVASVNAIQFTPISYFSFVAMHRYYDKKYQAFFANSFGQNSTTQNENGIYFGLQFSPFAYWKVSAYADFFKHPWLKYGENTPTNGKEYMIAVDYTPNRHFTNYLRYKQKQKENYQQHRLRWQGIYTFSAFTHKAAVNYIAVNKAEETSNGFLFSYGVGCKPNNLPLQLDLNLAWFQTDDYDTRLSSYEKNILYAFYIPSFYGNGFRLAGTLRWDVLTQLSIFAKIGFSHYTDRDIIGSDMEAINGDIKTDINTVIRWNF